VLNSRLGLVTAAPSRSPRQAVSPTGAPLLPKLRGQVAEFLDGGSLVHLGLLAQPTCVGLRYGAAPTSLAAFLARSGPAHSVGTVAPPRPRSSVNGPGHFRPGPPYQLRRPLWTLGLPHGVPASLQRSGGGRD
jgi:hypothetical protein